MLGQNVDDGVTDSPRLEISERQDSRRIEEYRGDRLDREAVQLTRPGRREIRRISDELRSESQLHGVYPETIERGGKTRRTKGIGNRQLRAMIS